MFGMAPKSFTYSSNKGDGSLPIMAALWVAASVAHARALAGTFKVAELGPTIEVTSGDERHEAMTQWALSIIGNRWEDLLERYQRDRWALVDQTLPILETARANRWDGQ